ncbi:hypothetical protein SEPCBS57363_006805, partial [Sporothrix epigloea]
MEIEAGVPPIEVRLDRAKHQYALRLLQLPRHHPIRVCAQPAKDELNSESDIAMLGFVYGSPGTTLQ